MAGLLGFAITVLVMALSLLIISKLPLGVEVDSVWQAIIAGAIIGILNGIRYIFPDWFKTLNTVLTLGLGPLIFSVIVFGLAAGLVQGFRLRWGIWSAILGAFALAIVNSLLSWVLGMIFLAIA